VCAAAGCLPIKTTANLLMGLTPLVDVHPDSVGVWVDLCFLVCHDDAMQLCRPSVPDHNTL
jgi:hypothetical protein